MAFITSSRVKETSTSTGTGNLTLAGAVSGLYKTFDDRCADADTFFYVIEHQSANEWETGVGTFVAATPAIARTTVLESSNGDAAVNFAAGTKHIFISPVGLRYGYFPNGLFLNGNQQWQTFAIEIFNNAGTLQARTVGSVTNAEAAAYANKIANQSNSRVNVPTVAVGQDFSANGLGITGAIIVLNTADQDAATYFGHPTVEYYTGNTMVPRAYAGFTSRNVNGTTKDRLEISLLNGQSGAAFTINTTNVPASQSIYVRWSGLLA